MENSDYGFNIQTGGKSDDDSVMKELRIKNLSEKKSNKLATLYIYSVHIDTQNVKYKFSKKIQIQR